MAPHRVVGENEGLVTGGVGEGGTPMKTWTRLHARLAQGGERGAGLLEYLFLVSLIAAVCITAVTFFGNQNNASMQKSANSIDGASVSCPAPGHVNPDTGVCEM